MKTLKTIIGLFLLTATLTSCDKETKDDADVAIIGLWQATKEIEVEFEDGKKVNEDTETDPGFYIEFRNDGRIYEDGELTGTYQLSSDKKKLTVRSEDETIDYDIKTLTKSSLILYREYDYTEDGKTYHETAEVHFRKIEK